MFLFLIIIIIIIDAWRINIADHRKMHLEVADQKCQHLSCVMVKIVETFSKRYVFLQFSTHLFILKKKTNSQ